MDRGAIQALLAHAGELIDAGRSAEALARLRRVDVGALDEELKIECECLTALATADMDQPETALDRLRELTEEYPNSPRIIGALGLVLSRIGYWDEAADTLEQAVELDPEDPSNLANLGLVLERMGEFASSKDAYERSLKHGAELAWVMPRLAVVQSELGERAAAKDTLRRHLKNAPDDLEQWITLAIMHSDDEEYDDAIAAYREAERIDSRSIMLRMNWGVTAIRAGKLEDARAQLRALTELEPDTSRPILLLAFLREAEGNDAEALRCYDEAVRVGEIGDSHELGYALEMAMDYAARRRMLDRCEALFREAYKLNACSIDLCDAYREATGQLLKEASWFSVLVEADYRPGLDEVTEPHAPESAEPRRFQRNFQLIARDRDDALTALQRLLEQMGERHVRIVEFLGEEHVEDACIGPYEIEPQSFVLAEGE